MLAIYNNIFGYKRERVGSPLELTLTPWHLLAQSQPHWSCREAMIELLSSTHSEGIPRLTCAN